MKVKLLILFCVTTVFLPILVFVILGLNGIPPQLQFYKMKYSICIIISLSSVVGFSLYLLKRKNIDWHLFVSVALMSFLIELITFPLRAFVIMPGIPGGFPLCSVAAFIFYFIFTNLMLKKYALKIKPHWILLAFLTGCSILQLPVRILDPISTLGSLPDFLFHLLGILMGYFYYFSSRNFKTGIILTSIICCSLLFLKGYDMWMHQLNYSTFTGKIKTAQTFEFQFQNEDGDTLSVSDFKGKYLIIDCWYTYCGVCYKKFPQVQKLFDKFKDDDEIALFSLHCRLKKAQRNEEETVKTGIDILKTRGFSFPCFSIDMDNPVLKELGVDSYPTVLIFNKESQLIFRGSIEYASKHISKIKK